MASRVQVNVQLGHQIFKVKFHQIKDRYRSLPWQDERAISVPFEAQRGQYGYGPDAESLNFEQNIYDEEEI